MTTSLFRKGLLILAIVSHDPTIQIQNGLEKTEKQTVLSKLKSYSNQYKIPSWIVSSIVEVESSFQTHLVGDSGKSFGLLQLYTGGGQGDGYSGRHLSNVDNNLKIGLPHLKKAYDQGIQKGLTGYSLLEYTAGHSGHPSHNGTFTPNYKNHLKKAYDNGDELNGLAGSQIIDYQLEFPMADPSLYLTGNTNGTDPILLGRLAMVSKDLGIKTHIVSGYRSNAEQQILWDKSDKSGKMVAPVGKSNHNKGKALDVSGKVRDMSSDSLKKYGLYKPMSYEPWHIELSPYKYTGVSFENSAKEIMKNGFDMMNIEDLSKGSYSFFSAIDNLGKTNGELNDKMSEGFGVANFVEGSGKAIFFRVVLVLIGLAIILASLRR
jgi:hypothetical protein